MEQRWITLLRFSTVHEAEVARGLLEAAGIEAHLLDTATASIAWHLAPAIGGVRLQVRPADRNAALEVLAGEPVGAPDEWYDEEAARPALQVIEGGAPDDEEDDLADDRPRHLREAAPSDLLSEEADHEARQLAKRALGAAVAGVFVPFVLHAWSAWLLWRLAQSPGTLDRRSRAWAAMALAIDALVLLPLAWLAAHYLL